MLSIRMLPWRRLPPSNYQAMNLNLFKHNPHLNLAFTSVAVLLFLQIRTIITRERGGGTVFIAYSKSVPSYIPNFCNSC